MSEGDSLKIHLMVRQAHHERFFVKFRKITMNVFL